MRKIVNFTVLLDGCCLLLLPFFVSFFLSLHFICCLPYAFITFIVYLDVSLVNCIPVRCFAYCFFLAFGVFCFFVSERNRGRMCVCMCVRNFMPFYLCSFLYSLYTNCSSDVFIFSLHLQLYRNKCTLRRFALLSF